MDTGTTEQVQVSHRYRSAARKLFDAWVDPAIMQKWLFVGPSSKIIKADIDLRKGGSFSILELELSNGTYIDHFGHYDVEPPHKLSFTLSVPRHFDGVTRVAIEIKPEDGTSLLTLTQTGVSPEKTEKNWREMLQQLETMLKEN